MPSKKLDLPLEMSGDTLRHTTLNLYKPHRDYIEGVLAGTSRGTFTAVINLLFKALHDELKRLDLPPFYDPDNESIVAGVLERVNFRISNDELLINADPAAITGTVESILGQHDSGRRSATECTGDKRTIFDPTEIGVADEGDHVIRLGLSSALSSGSTPPSNVQGGTGSPGPEIPNVRAESPSPSDRPKGRKRATKRSTPKETKKVNKKDRSGHAKGLGDMTWEEGK